MQETSITLNIAMPEVIVKLNATYNTLTQQFDFNPSDFSSGDFSTT